MPLSAFNFEPDRIERARRFNSRGGGWRSRAILIGLGVFVVLLVLALSSTGFYVNLLWFRSLGFESVYLTTWAARGTLFVAAFALFILLFGGNLRLAKALARRDEAPPLNPEAKMLAPSRLAEYAINGVGTIIALIMASVAAANWATFLRFGNATSFGTVDPIFKTDIGFYVFSLPLYRFVQGWLMGALFIILIGVAIVYAFDFRQQRFAFTFNPGVKAHLSAIGAAILALMAIGYRLDIFELVYSTRGVVFGAAYTDVNAQWGALDILFVIAAATAVLLIVNVFLRGIWLPALGLGVWIVMAILVGAIYPAIIQQFQVVPSQLVKEKLYIQNNITMTRQAYGLESIQEQNFPFEDALQASDIRSNLDTVTNVRLWDYKPLQDTYNQIQSIRLYYDFHDVDYDRYVIDGRLRQVALSARELSPEKLAQQAQTWVNQRLQYTHGYGVALSPVTEVSGEGLPDLLIKDIPPAGKIDIKQPAIYFGEVNDRYVVVNTKADEFDYPKGDENVYTSYAGQGGVGLNSLIRKLAFAWNFGDLNLLLTNYLKPESRILYYRSIADRVQRIAPFLKLDADPYIVIADGRLYWIQDAYTTSDQYPYSQPYEERPAGSTVPTVRFNYIRNSVKAVIDAYEGTVRLYVNDAKDPLIQTYRRIFPSLFTDMDQMPATLRAHVRYPEYLFTVQADRYRTYHMQDPQVLYNSEDLWSFPKEVTSQGQARMAPYYVNMRLPGETNTEFLIMVPFTPSNKDNMVAWLAALSDGGNYGKMVSYKFPKERLIYGPAQLDARINQDPTISGQLTLWNQQGSRVIRGNLLVIPIGKSILYVQPIYLQAENSQLPELKRVISATGNRLSMEVSLEASLSKVFDTPVNLPISSGQTTPTPVGQVTPTPTPAVGPSPTPRATPPPGATPTALSGPVSTQIAQLAQSASDHYTKAQDYLKQGDWARYGEEMNAMQQDLNRLVQLTKQP